MTTTVTSISAKAFCPTGTISTGQNIQFESIFKITSKNNAAKEDLVYIEIKLEDSDGHEKEDKEPLLIEANSQVTQDYTSYLTASFDHYGKKTVKVSIVAKPSSGSSKSATDTCSFKVSGPDASISS